MPGLPGFTRPYPMNRWIVPLAGLSTPPLSPPAVKAWSSPMLGMLMRTALDVGVPTDAPPVGDPACEVPAASLLDVPAPDIPAPVAPVLEA